MSLVDCANATSLFELGFGANAVLAVLAERTANAKEYFLSRYLDALVRHDRLLDRKRIDRPEIHDILIGGLQNYRHLLQFSIALRVLAAAMLLISVGTLLQNALWGSACKIESEAAILYVALAFLILPFAYYLYSKALQLTTQAAIDKTIPSATELAAALVVDLELGDRGVAIASELAALAQQLSAAIEKDEPAGAVEARIKALTNELKTLPPEVERSRAAVLATFKKAMAERSDG
jgi:hypothetical protein